MIEEFQERTKEIIFKQEGLEEGWIELKNQISRCTVSEKVRIKERIIGIRNTPERREKLEKRTENGEKER